MSSRQSTILLHVGSIYIAIEIIFYLVFRWYLVPRANRRTSPPLPYRDYPALADRHQLLVRILKRLLVDDEADTIGSKERVTKAELELDSKSIHHHSPASYHQDTSNNDPRGGAQVVWTARQRQVIQDFLLQWFHCSDETAETIQTRDASTQPFVLSVKGTAKQQHPSESRSTGSSGLSSTTTRTNHFLPRFKHKPSSSSSSSSSSSTSTTSLSSTTETRDPDEELSSFEHAAAVSLGHRHSHPQRQSPDNHREAHEQRKDASNYWTVPGLTKDDTDPFFAWAFFGKHLEDLTGTEQVELNRCYEEIRTLLQLVFYPKHKNQEEPSTAPLLKVHSPRRLTLEDVDPIHRPLLVYILVAFLKILGGCYLRWIGFQRMVSKPTGLVAWYRPAQKMTSTTKLGSSGNTTDRCRNDSTASSSPPLMPLLFFHGIAPGGLILYLPMVLKGLLGSSTSSSSSSSTERISGHRDCFLFENHSISCTLRFSALTEEQTVMGVQEIVETALGPTNKQGLVVVGHSFGSCPLTWLLHSRQTEFRHRIRQLVLIDPVTILLSEPDVMINFLYARTVNHIRMVASSELFTEYYLRRHFAWYNSELWLEDLCRLLQPNAQILVCLSEHDEILNAPKVKKQIDRHVQQQQMQSSTGHHLRVLYWTHVGHANCVSSPQKWKEMQQIMLEQELLLAQHDKVQ